ncbi:hypothetical protein CUMW_134970 [Citrus unshiu]|nr:hypothetical protein CUMW_134970 [Citrus unshiu]
MAYKEGRALLIELGFRRLKNILKDFKEGLKMKYYKGRFSRQRRSGDVDSAKARGFDGDSRGA